MSHKKIQEIKAQANNGPEFVTDVPTLEEQSKNFEQPFQAWNGLNLTYPNPHIRMFFRDALHCGPCSFVNTALSSSFPFICPSMRHEIAHFYEEILHYAFARIALSWFFAIPIREPETKVTFFDGIGHLYKSRMTNQQLRNLFSSQRETPFSFITLRNAFASLNQAGNTMFNSHRTWKFWEPFFEICQSQSQS